MAAGWPARGQIIEETTVPDWAVGGFSQMQIYAQRDLYKSMLACAYWLHEHIKKTGTPPQSSDDIGALCAEAETLIPENPFAPGSGRKPPVRMVFDDSMSEPVLNQYRANPPASWSAPAGTITVVISNSHDFFLVWGAGFDNRPIKHEATHKVLFVRGRLHPGESQ